MCSSDLIYTLKSGESDDCPQKTKFLHHLGSENFNESEYEAEKKFNNNKFTESIRVENVYNRIIMFEGGVYHGVPSYYSDNNEPRLTQVFFVKNLNSSVFSPIIRSRLSCNS